MANGERTCMRYGACDVDLDKESECSKACGEYWPTVMASVREAIEGFDSAQNMSKSLEALDRIERKGR